MMLYNRNIKIFSLLFFVNLYFIFTGFYSCSNKKNEFTVSGNGEKYDPMNIPGNKNKDSDNINGNLESDSSSPVFDTNLVKYDKSFYSILIPYRKGDKWGYCNYKKEIIIPCKYNAAEPFSEGIAAVSLDSVGYIDENDNIIIKHKYDIGLPFHNSAAAVSKNNRWGFADKKGNEITPMKYAWTIEYHEEIGLPDGYVNFNGNEIMPFRYGQYYTFNEGFAPAIYPDGNMVYIDKSGKEIIKNAGGYFNEGRGLIYKKDKYGFANKNGEIVIACKYKNAYNFTEGYAAVMINNKWGFIGKSGKTVIPFSYSSVYGFNEGLAPAAINDLTGFINKKGETVIPLKFHSAYCFNEGLAPVMINHKWGYIDKKGNEVIPRKFDEAGGFIEGLALVKLDTAYGYINKQGKVIIPFKYKLAGAFHNGIVYVRSFKQNEYGYIDKKGIEYWEE